jgi:putative glycosyltransferase
MQLSIISTLYRSTATIDEFIKRITASAEQVTRDYELVLVNDGSPDDSLQKALAAQQLDSRIIIIDLSRNFGHHEAGMSGIEKAQGDFVFLIDSDLEEAPELLLEFWQKMQQSQSTEVIYGIQEQRKGNWFERLSGSLFYKIFNKLSDIKISPNILTIRLMNRQYVDAITQYQERNLFVAGIMAHAGFNQQTLVVSKKSKHTTSYTFSKRLKLFFVCITSFSSKLFEYILVMGGGLLLLSLLTSVYFCFQYLVFNVSLSIIKTILLATGVITGSLLSCTGLLGFYISSISTEVKQRPRAIIRNIYSKKID